MKQWFAVFGIIAAFCAVFGFIIFDIRYSAKIDCVRTIEAVEACKSDQNCRYDAGDIREYQRCQRKLK